MFHEILGRILQNRSWTGYRLAKETGISQGLMVEYLHGKKTPSATNIKKIADALGVSVDYLLGKEVHIQQPTLNLTPKEIALILAYRAHPNMQPAVDTLLQLQNPTDVSADATATISAGESVFEKIHTERK